MNIRCGSVKCKCRECGEERFVQRMEWARAAQPRCFGCGGGLDIVNKQAHARLTRANDAARTRKSAMKEKQESHNKLDR